MYKGISKFVMALGVMLALIACSSKPAYVTQNKIYADVMGFSDTVMFDYRFYQLSGSKEEYNANLAAIDETIHSLERGSNTALFYSMDVALDRIRAVYRNSIKNSQNTLARDTDTRYYIVILTDGLDNISTQLARNNGRGRFSDVTEYAAKLQERMSTIFGKGNKTNIFQSYVLVFKGADLQGNGFTDAEIRRRMAPLTGAQNAPRPQPIVSDDTRELLTQFVTEFRDTYTYTSFSFLIPKGYADKNSRVSMQLVDAFGNACAFEGTFTRRGGNLLSGEGKYTFEDIKTSEGFTFAELVDGSLQEDTADKNSTNARFTITHLHYSNTLYEVADNKQYIYDEGAWRMNSERGSGGGKDRNAYILLLLDRSRSLTDQDVLMTEETVLYIIRNMIEAL
jgi:hypothetical protein